MKYLIWLVIVFAGIWWLRQQRQTTSGDTPEKTTQATRPKHGGPQVMVPCAHCGAHVPEADAVQGKQGLYCSEAHRQRQEG
jgi:uncharacterized protein